MIPETRSELFLANIAGEENELPPPQSRIEHYLNAIAQAGTISGGSAGAVLYDSDANYPDGSVGTAMQEMEQDIETTSAEVDNLKSEIIDLYGGSASLIDGGYVKHIDGTIGSAAGYSYIGFYPVISGGYVHVETYMGYSAGLAFYDKDENVVSTISNGSNENVLYNKTLPVPQDAVFIRVSCVKTHKDEFVIENKVFEAVADANTYLYSAYHTSTAEGEIASFSDGAKNVPVVSATIFFGPNQSGEGTPTKDNVRNFSPISGVTLTVAETQNGDGADYEWEFPSAVYIGKVSTNGELYTTGIIFKPTAPDAMVSVGSGKYRAKFLTPSPITVASVSTPNPGLFCNMYQTKSANGTYLKNTGISDGGANSYVYIYDPDLQTQEDWETYLSSHELQIVIPLATPTKSTVSAKDVLTLYGDNYFRSDGTKVSVTYRADPNLYIADYMSIKNPCDYDGDEISVFNKGLCIGDSMTVGTFNYYDDGSIYNYITDAKYSYPTYLKKLTGVDVTNLGTGGVTFAQWYSAHSSDDLSGHDFAIIQLGINDVLNGSTWGSAQETALANIITKLKTDNKNIKIFVANIIPASYYSTQADKTFSDALLSWVKTTYSADPDVFALDINQYGHTNDSESYNLGHLSALGYRRLAQDYKGYISYIIANNLDKFSEVQFVGTDYVFAH